MPMGADEVVKKLRRAERYCLNEYSQMASQAARLIDSLQAQLAEERQYNADLIRQSDGLMVERQRLKVALVDSQRREQAAVKDMTDMANVAQDAEVCEFCKRYGEDKCQSLNGDDTAADGTGCFEWRGPQESGEGAAEHHAN